MNGWQMDLPGLSGVLSSTQEELVDLQGVFFGDGDALAAGFNDDVVEGLADTTGFDNVVYEAVVGLLADQLENRVAPALSQYATALSAASEAALAVKAGDEDSAAGIVSAMNGADVSSIDGAS